MGNSKPDTLKSFTEFMEAQDAIVKYMDEHGRGCDIPEDLKENLFKAQEKYRRDKREVGNG